MRAFTGARQDTRQAVANTPPGINGIGPAEAARTMHAGLADDPVSRMLGHGSRNVPIHPAQVPTEGSDKQGWGGDAAVHDPTGQGRGT